MKQNRVTESNVVGREDAGVQGGFLCIFDLCGETRMMRRGLCHGKGGGKRVPGRVRASAEALSCRDRLARPGCGKNTGLAAAQWVGGKDGR